MKVVHSSTYDIIIGEDSLQTIQYSSYSAIAILVDEHTKANCLDIFLKESQIKPKLIIEIHSGEKHKNISSCKHIWQQLTNAQFDRKSLFINLGGGVIGDMGGFAASCYKRGIDFIQVPTTLLAMVDASVGGKLGIDFFGVKNSIGLFRDPRAVWADPRFFQTLSARELRSGFAEIIKHALIADERQWNDLQTITQLETVDWADWVARSVAIKQQIVAQDPLEKGLRKALNFGHTIGHAVESYFLETDKPLLHGEAIAIGMICESWLSAEILGLSEAELSAITAFFLKWYGHRALPLDKTEQLLATMRQDKKNEDSRINFSLVPTIGKVEVNQTATIDLIQRSLAFYNTLSA